MSSFPGHYVLMGKLAVPEPNFLKWAMWFGTVDRRVAETIIGPIRVSTIFLGLDHAFGRNQLPLVFETMIFRGGDGDETYRYSSWEEAEAGHTRAVAEVRAEILTKAKS